MSTDAQIAKALTPDSPSGKPTLAEVKKTLDELRNLPEKDREELRTAYESETKS